VTRDQPVPVEPAKYSIDEVDEIRRIVEDITDVTKGAGSHEIRPDKDVCKDVKPCKDTPRGRRK